jgi:hypothetical protein
MHPSLVHPHPSPVHAAAGIAGREPGEQKNEGRYDEFSHIALLHGLILKSFDTPVDADAINERQPEDRPALTFVEPALLADGSPCRWMR